MASAQVVETLVTNNSPSQDSNHPDDLFQSRYSYSDTKQVNSTVDDFISSTWESSDFFSTRPIFRVFHIGGELSGYRTFSMLSSFSGGLQNQTFE